MKKIIIALAFLIGTLSLHAQNVKQDASGNYVAVKSIKSAKADSSTGKTYTDSKGVIYPVFVSSTGKLYVNRISKNTGTQYRYYLKVN